MQWILVFHLVGVILWLGTLLVLSRLFADHAQAGAAVPERLAQLERRLFNTGAHPGAALAVATGILMVLLQPGEYLPHGWFHTKLLLVLLLLGLHLRLFRRMAILHRTPTDASRREFIFAHGLIGLTLLLILIMVLVRPF